MLKKSLLAVALAFASSGAFAAAETYVMDNNHTQVEFSWNHFGFSNPVANFDNIEGSINYDADDITKSSVEVTTATSRISTSTWPAPTSSTSPSTRVRHSRARR